MKTIQHQGWTEIRCAHAVLLDERADKSTFPSGASVAKNAVELEPAVLFMCCDWCMAKLQLNALRSMKQPGLKITIETTEVPKPLSV